MAALAETNFVKNDLIKKKGSSYVVNLYPLGFKMPVAVNSTLPAKGGKPVFAGFGSTDAVWSAVTEKAVAKVVGNYDFLEGGWIEEGLRLLTGAPADTKALAG